MKQFAMIFPGQGSQKLGMLRELADTYPVVTKTFAEASDILGYDLWQLCQRGPEAELNQTEKTQPALLTAGFAIWRLWQQQGGVKPAMLAGHSLGEYTALVCAQALAFTDGVNLVAKRGEFMQAAVPQGTGAMAAVIGLDDEITSKLCDDTRQQDVLSTANYNSIGQTVVAGSTDAIERFMLAAEQAGAKKVVRLEVSVPSHCELMRPAAERLQTLLQSITINTPAIPVIQNADVQAYQDPTLIRDALVRQLFSPVRWVETVQWFAKQGIEFMLEAAPGKVLTGLNKRIVADTPTYPMNKVTEFQHAIEQTSNVLGEQSCH